MEDADVINETPEKYLRLREIVAPNGFLSISRSAWYAGIAEGRYPAVINAIEQKR